MKRFLAIFLSAALIVSAFSAAVISTNAARAAEKDTAGEVYKNTGAEAGTSAGEIDITALKDNSLYAHGSSTSGNDTEAWVRFSEIRGGYYFFMPSSADSGAVEIFNSFSQSATLAGKTIEPSSSAIIAVEPNGRYTATVGERSFDIVFKFSTAEAALWVNNEETFDGEDFFTYLKYDKANNVAATGAVSDDSGNIEVVDIKKIKGRGNTSWNADKKGFNVNFKNAVSVAGMEKTKKFSLLANFQDPSLARNRILYDLADAVGVPYASDSRFIDFYTNGEYQGSYQMCQKIEVGNNALISDVAEDDYLDQETGGVKTDFSFLVEIDPSPNADDITFKTDAGLPITINAPELEASDPNLSAVRGYIKRTFNAMYNKLTSTNADLDDYIDIDSLAKVYLINELGKNWDCGVASFYFVYKPDENGKYKYFASPVWDYDNSLGNANGVDSDLRRMGVSDYLLPSGWYATKKNAYYGPNFLTNATKNRLVMNRVYDIWFEDFLPSLLKLNRTGLNTGEIYSYDVYRDYLSGSADMNYMIWDLIGHPTWVADHSSLKKITGEYTYNAYGQVIGASATTESRATAYDQNTFAGQFDFLEDWTDSRVAWISAQYIENYTPVEPSEPPTEEPTEPPTEAPSEEPPALDLSNAIAAWIFDSKDKTPGEKLTEYGSADGYAATKGEGTLSTSVNGEKKRALEWSAAEYGKTGVQVVPIMAAGSNNLWGTPYIDLDLNGAGYDTLELTMYLAGSNKAPATWKLTYSTDGETFTDVEGAQFTIPGDENRKILTAYFNKTKLPDDAAAENLKLRLVPVSMTTVSGGDTSEKPSGGEIALNYIVVSGYRDGDYPKGDVDLSGKVEITDATYIQQYLADLISLNELQQQLGDVDRDGKVTIVDATYIQQYLADIIPDLDFDQEA